jgi:hypothetical protein
MITPAPAAIAGSEAAESPSDGDGKLLLAKMGTGPTSVRKIWLKRM